MIQHRWDVELKAIMYTDVSFYILFHILVNKVWKSETRKPNRGKQEDQEFDREPLLLLTLSSHVGGDGRLWSKRVKRELCVRTILDFCVWMKDNTLFHIHDFSRPLTGE